jgi:hypothetical protein
MGSFCGQSSKRDKTGLRDAMRTQERGIKHAPLS